MPPRSRKSSLKQATLPFAASKPSAATNQAKKPTKPAGSRRRSRSTIELESSSDGDNVDDIELAKSDDSDSDPVESPNDLERPKAEGLRPPAASEKKKGKQSVKEKILAPVPITKTIVNKPSSTALSKQKEVQAEAVRPELNVIDPAYRKLYNEARDQMSYAKPIHGENQNRINDILRVFDLTYKYGPCVGVSRLERWQRAKALGLDPPHEIYDILNTKEGVSQEEYSQSVFHGEI